jgi:hypothetical protein
LNHVLRNKFTHKTAINNSLVLIAFALKSDKTCANTNIQFNTFLHQNREDGGVKSLLGEFEITLEKMDVLSLCKCMTDDVAAIEAFDERQLSRLTTMIYRTSVDMFERVWSTPAGRAVLQKTVFKNDGELRLFCFGVINYGNRELAGHIFSMDAQNKYGINVTMMREFIATVCVNSFSDRVSCLKVLVECVDVPVDVLRLCLKTAMDRLAVDAFRFLKQQGVSM